MKDFKSLNVYLSNIAVMTTKLHNLHWNVEGRNFYQTHTFTEGLYDTFFEWYDEVAESIKMRGGFPCASLKEYIEIATIKELESKKVTVDEVNEIVMNDLVALKEEATKIREEADEAGDFIIVGMLEGHIGELQKNIWFFRASKTCCHK
ncbi:DNA starvation/stationary phase protection protein [uncultured Parvimonas sp.]|uniref:Dps family protein n=1 Tax=uncultured Parvimonas sp. TaxID=747372 RepID=UPI00288AD995|nr:DNA starvation/stationary phase protection protein [uncultured Parvimonas sp.]